MRIRRLGALTGALVLAFASVATAFATDNDHEAKIKVNKSASDQSLPYGGGEVTFTYTVTNPGDKDLEGVVIGDDLCSPVEYQSGDTGDDQILEPGEAWVYTCTKEVTETEENTATVAACTVDEHVDDNAVAAHDDNDGPCEPSAEDGCKAAENDNDDDDDDNDVKCVDDKDDLTVEVSLLNISVDKTASSTDLAFGGGSVTFTYKVKNIGDAPLVDVEIADDKCSPVGNRTSDGNDDDTLAVDETWTFTCTKTVTASETNTATASGCDSVAQPAHHSSAPPEEPECVEATDQVTVNVSQVESATDAPTLPPTSTTIGSSSNGGGSVLWIAGILAAIAALALVATPKTSRRRR